MESQLKELYRLPSAGQQVNRLACFMLASYVAFLGCSRMQQLLAPPFPVHIYFYWFAQTLAILSPACIAVGWLRLTGMKWQAALLLFLYVPVGALIIWLIAHIPLSS